LLHEIAVYNIYPEFDIIKNYGICTNDCGEGYFENLEFNDCQPCYHNCKFCFRPLDKTGCDACYDGEFLMKFDGEVDNTPTIQKNGICQDDCGQGSFENDELNLC